MQTLTHFAHHTSFDLERSISSLSFRSVFIGTLTLVVLITIGALIRARAPRLKLPVFLLIVGTVLTTTGILAASTVYLNVKSTSNGPVHWHADFEIWACDQKLDLRDPNGFLSNKIGTASLHEHNDGRIHLEGVVVDEQDASLGKFMDVVGGDISSTSLTVPLNDDKVAVYKNGASCPDSDNNEVQVFVYSTEVGIVGGRHLYAQRKIDDPAHYVIAPQSQVPPGDCIIIEFGPPRERTDHKCLQYQVQDEELHKYREVQ